MFAHPLILRLLLVLSPGTTLAVAIAFALCAGNAWADVYSDISKLLNSEQYAQALVQIDAQLKDTPSDAQVKFMKGLAQEGMGQMQAAQETYTLLTQDYPELAEPHNNLAAIYAAQGDMDKAKALLEAAVRANPAYATGYENLGDIYARLAQRAYARALQLESNNRRIPPKLVILGTMLNPKPAPPPASPPLLAPATTVPSSSK